MLLPYLSELIAFLALLLSLYSTYKTIQFNKRQDELTAKLIEKEEAESVDKKRAFLNATIIKLGQNNYRLKVWNQGKATAHNVHIQLLKNSDLLHPDFVNSIFPLESLEPYQSVEMPALVHMQTEYKHPLEITWSDEYDKQNRKVVYLTI